MCVSVRSLTGQALQDKKLDEKLETVTATLKSLLVQAHRSVHNLSTIGSKGWRKIHALLKCSILPCSILPVSLNLAQTSPTELFVWDSSKEDSAKNIDRCTMWLQKNLALGTELELLCSANIPSLLDFEVLGMLDGVEEAVSHPLLCCCMSGDCHSSHPSLLPKSDVSQRQL